MRITKGVKNPVQKETDNAGIRVLKTVSGDEELVIKPIMRLTKPLTRLILKFLRNLILRNFFSIMCASVAYKTAVFKRK